MPRRDTARIAYFRATADRHDLGVHAGDLFRLDVNTQEVIQARVLGSGLAVVSELVLGGEAVTTPHPSFAGAASSRQGPNPPQRTAPTPRVLAFRRPA